MKLGQGLKAFGTTLVFAGAAIAGLLLNSPRGKANDDDEERRDSRIEQGFAIAPVPLNLEGKNRALVGLGSYIVNDRATAMVATAPALLLNSPRAETHTLASRRRSIRRPTWAEGGISVRFLVHLLLTLFPAT